MVDAAIYYRTPTSVADPMSGNYVSLSDLLSKPAYQIQRIIFTFPNKALDGVRRRYENNIKKIPVSTPDGTRLTRLQENGLSSHSLVIRGLFNNPNSNGDLSLLEGFKIALQTDSYHIYGHFGFYSPNAGRFSVEPNKTHGLVIDYVEEGRVGQKGTVYDFEVGFSNVGFAVVEP